jgi:hypothetical protein
VKEAVKRADYEHDFSTRSIRSSSSNTSAAISLAVRCAVWAWRDVVPGNLRNITAANLSAFSNRVIGCNFAS